MGSIFTPAVLRRSGLVILLRWTLIRGDLIPFHLSISLSLDTVELLDGQMDGWRDERLVG